MARYMQGKMARYIQVEDDGESKYLPVERDNTVLLETLQSAFPQCYGLTFEIESKCFVVKLDRGIFFLPAEWWKYCYQPVYDNYDDYQDDENDYYNDDD